MLIYGEVERRGEKGAGKGCGLPFIKEGGQWKPTEKMVSDQALRREAMSHGKYLSVSTPGKGGGGQQMQMP